MFTWHGVIVALALAPASQAAIAEADAGGSWLDGDGCTSIIVASGGVAEGGTITTHTDDCMECDFRISKVPAASHPAGSVREVYAYRAAYPRWLGYGRGSTYEPQNTDLSIGGWEVGVGPFAPIGSIAQVPKTYGYIDGGYGIMNEHQVSIGESTCGTKITALPVHLGGKALLEAGELSRIALERCATALCAVETMGALAQVHGYYGADATPGEGGEALQVVDTNEAWVFHMLADDTGASAVWAAQRVPDGHLAAVANQFIIRTVNLTDSANFRGSDNILEVATRTGLWDEAKQGSLVDFTAAFGLDRGTLSPYANRRRWRVYSLAAPKLAASGGLPAEVSTFADEYPFSVPVETKLTAKDVLAMHRDHYEGTPYDMTRGLAGGPYGDPSRFDMGGNRAVYANESPDSEDPQILAADAVDDAEVFSGKFERAISIFRCAYSWVGHARPQVDGRYGVVWFGQYAPHASGASAVYAGVGDVPSVYGVGSLYRASLEASYWVHAVLGNWCNRFFVHTIGDIKAKQDELESSAFTAHAALEDKVASLVQQEAEGSPAAGLELEVLLTGASLEDALSQHKSWSEFLFVMLAKYKDGQRIDDFHAVTLKPTKLFYPQWWLQTVGYYDQGGSPPDDLLPNATPKEGDSAPPASSSSSGFAWPSATFGARLSAIWSHFLVAVAAVAVTYAYLSTRSKDASAGPVSSVNSVVDAPGFGVELPSLARAKTRRTYQQLV